MKFLKSKLLVGLLGLSLVGVVGASLVACTETAGEEDDTTYTITWEYDTDAVSITYEDSTTLPTSLESGSELRFTVTANTGYEIDSVRANGTRLPNSSGEYYTTITADTTVTITTTETVTSLTIVSYPDKLTYVDGESIDVTGMVVQANYGTGRTATIEYGSDGYSVSPSVFSGGDTSFRVTYEGVSTTVELESVVEYVVNIDLDGGELSESYLAYLEGLELNNYTYDSTAGTIYFTYYQDLPEEGITLPTTSGDDVELTRTASTFNGWSGISGSTITNTSGSLSISANWQYQLIVPTKAELIEEDGIPYLVVDGEYGISGTRIYLFLYEGNKDISLIDENNYFEGNAGDTFELKFDLRQLSDQGSDYVGSWMDIKFAAYVDGEFETMDIDVDTIEVDLDQIARYSDENGGYTYSFQTWTSNGITTLKVMFNEYYLSYTVEDVETIHGVDYLILSGQVAETYYGYTIRNTWWVSSEIGPYDAVASETDGTFTLYINLEDFTEATDSYAHYEILDTSGNSIYGGTNTNLQIADATNSFPTLEDGVNAGSITNAISFTTDTYTYYVGYAWDGLMLYKTSGLGAYDMSLTEEHGIVYLNYQFEYGTADPYTQAPWLRVQEINNSWTGVYFGRYGENDEISISVDRASGIATYSVPISNYEDLLALATTSGKSFTVHYALSEPDGDNGWSNFDNFTTGTSITSSSYQYELSTDVDDVNWLNTCLRITQVA